MSNLAAKMRLVSDKTIAEYVKNDVDDAIEQLKFLYVPTIEKVAFQGRTSVDFQLSSNREHYVTKLKNLLYAEGFILSHSKNVLTVAW